MDMDVDMDVGYSVSAFLVVAATISPILERDGDWWYPSLPQTLTTALHGYQRP